MDKIEDIKKWVKTALTDAIDELRSGCEKEKGMSDFERGKACGGIKAFQRIELQMTELKVLGECAFTTWIGNISDNTPLSVADAIKIYDFCSCNDLLKQHKIVERIAVLSLQGHKWSDITNLSKLEALKKEKQIYERYFRR
jgi:hypothetical protein